MRAVLAYDASAGAGAAASLVQALRWPPGSALRVVAVIEPTAALVPIMPTTPGALVTSPEIDAKITEYLQEEVTGVAGRLRTGDVDADGVVLRGRPATAVIDEAQRFGADVVVAGSRGHGAIASLVLGSVSAALVDEAPCPVLVARQTTATRVLLATDGSASAGRAESIVREWPIFDEAAIHVVSVAEVVRPWHAGLTPELVGHVLDAFSRELDAAKTRHEALARDAAQRLKSAGRAVEPSFRVGDPAAQILEEASAWQADLIVLGSRGMTGLSRIVLGSVARNVLQGAACSVLIFRESPGTSGG